MQEEEIQILMTAAAKLGVQVGENLPKLGSTLKQLRKVMLAVEGKFWWHFSDGYPLNFRSSYLHFDCK